MYGALYGACMVHVWCISTILYGANRLLCRGGDTPSKKQKRIQKYEKAVAKAAEDKAETMVAAAVASYKAEEQGDAKFDASLVSAIEQMTQTDGTSSTPKPEQKPIGGKLAQIVTRLGKQKKK